MPFLIAGIVLDLGKILPLLHENNIDTCGRGVAISSPSSVASQTSLLVLVLLRVGGESLLSRIWLFSTRYVSKGGVDVLITSGVLVLLLCGSVPLKTPGVYFVIAKRWLEHCFCLCIDGFFPWPLPRSSGSGFEHPIGPVQKVSELLGSIGSWSSYSELQ